MPTLLLLNGYKFFFFSNESNEPIHIHITKASAEAKVWLEPTISIAYVHEFNSKEIKFFMEIIENNHQQFKTKWHEFFNQ